MAHYNLPQLSFMYSSKVSIIDSWLAGGVSGSRGDPSGSPATVSIDDWDTISLGYASAIKLHEEGLLLRDGIYHTGQNLQRKLVPGVRKIFVIVWTSIEIERGIAIFLRMEN